MSFVVTGIASFNRKLFFENILQVDELIDIDTTTGDPRLRYGSVEKLVNYLLFGERRDFEGRGRRPFGE